MTFSNILRLLKWNKQRTATPGRARSRPAITSTSASNKSLGSPFTASTPPAVTSAHRVAPNMGIIENTNQTQGCSSNIQSPEAQDNLRWIIFGIQGVQPCLEIEQIPIFGQMNDQTFFSELKVRYNKHRSYFRRFLSAFQSRHCKYVQFEDSGINKVFSLGEGLPDGAFAHDYEYSPTPPKATIPLIDPGTFARFLQACNEDCMWSILGPRLHSCFHIPPRFKRLGVIPKKKSRFHVNLNDEMTSFAWGIEADYALSFLHLAIYHLIPLLSGFIFWVYWLATHPEDWQNASVPTLTTLACMAVFWVPFGSIYNSHLRV